ncbi:MAG: hypothetical protein ACKVPX_07910 [Myxococcaceae bacterium]
MARTGAMVTLDSVNLRKTRPALARADGGLFPLETTNQPDPPELHLPFPDPVALFDAETNPDLFAQREGWQKLSPAEAEWARRSKLRSVHDGSMKEPYHSVGRTRGYLNALNGPDDLTRLAARDVSWDGFRLPNGVVVLSENTGVWPAGVSRPNPERARGILANRVVAHDERADAADMVERLAHSLPDDVLTVIESVNITVHLGGGPEQPPPRLDDPCADFCEWLLSAMRHPDAHGQYFPLSREAWVYSLHLSRESQAEIAQHEILHGVDRALGSHGREFSEMPEWLALDASAPKKITGNAQRKPVEHFVDALNVLTRPLRAVEWGAPSLVSREMLQRDAEPVFEFVRQTLAVRLPEAIASGTLAKPTAAELLGPLIEKWSGQRDEEGANAALMKAIVHQRSEALDECFAILDELEAKRPPDADSSTQQELREWAHSVREYLVNGTSPTAPWREYVQRQIARQREPERAALPDFLKDWATDCPSG